MFATDFIVLFIGWSHEINLFAEECVCAWPGSNEAIDAERKCCASFKVGRNSTAIARQKRACRNASQFAQKNINKNMRNGWCSYDVDERQEERERRYIMV